MKAINTLRAALVIVLVIAVSFYTGREYEAYYYNYDNLFLFNQQLKDSCVKHYEAACILKDICKYQLEYHDEDGEFAELYYDYLSNLDCYNWHITKEDIANNYNETE